MRVRMAKRKPTLCIQCSRCLRYRYYHSAREIELCRCGAVTGIVVMGRIEYEDLSDGKEDERVAAYRAQMREREQRQSERDEVEASRHGAGRKVKFVIRKRDATVGTFKIVKRNPASKTAQAGNVKTGAKVEKVKAGRRGSSEGVPGRFIGKTTGLSISKFQNRTIEDNRKKRLTDEQLVRVWKSEFPNAKSDYTPQIVAGVRGLYNKGKHGNDAPRVPVPQFDDDGQPMPFRGEKSAARREAREEEEARPVRRLKQVEKPAAKRARG